MSRPPPRGAPAPDDRTGRYRQRQRTRQAILEAAQRLLEAGHEPTVAEAADAATVSRATAYRYFPSQQDLLFECSHHVGWPQPAGLFVGPDAPSDPEERVVLVHDFFYDYISARDAQFRRYLRHQLLIASQPGTEERAVRPGYRIGLIETALEPVAAELGPARLARLQHALGVLIGTEALIASADVLHLDHDTARADNRWACRLLVRAARAEAASDGDD
jgi:AcrR family transcriptional regulator